MNITQTIIDITNKQLDRADIKIKDRLNSLGGDSLDQVEIIMQIEDEYNVEIDDNEFCEIERLSDIVILVEGKVNA